MDSVIVTFYPKFIKEAREECMLAGGSDFRGVYSGLAFIKVPLFSDFAGLLACAPPIFTRHIMPIYTQGELSLSREADLPLILEAAKAAGGAGEGESFAVCCRVFRLCADYNAKDVEVFVGSYFDKLGAAPAFSDYELNDGVITVINVVIMEKTFYIGVSSSAMTISKSADEYRVLSRHARVVNRAENKLIEAVSRYKLSLQGGMALDIGASPGGWTNVLATYGYSVVSVDPGELNPAVLSNPSVTHIKDRIQNVKFNKPFDITVNDMNVSSNETALVMNGLAPLMKQGAAAVVTLKLAFADSNRQIREAAVILNREYDITNIANLSHNRAEVTAILRRL